MMKRKTKDLKPGPPILTRKTMDLKPSPHIQKLYGDFSLLRTEDEELYFSIRENGILEPLIISTKNEIISGYRRHEVALQLGIKEVLVIITPVDEVSEVLVVQHNIQRIKNEAQWTYDILMLKKAFGSKQGVSLPKDKEEILNDAKKKSKKVVSEKGQKRVIQSVGILQRLNSNCSEEDAFRIISDELEKGKSLFSILTHLEKEEADLKNERAMKNFEDFEVEQFQIINSDSFEAAKQIKKGSIQNLTSSPPYWHFARDYDSRENAKTIYPLGKEPTPLKYVKSLGEIIVSYKSVMKKGGSVFINVMDKNYKNSPSGIPHHLADYLKKNGFHYKQPILWFKKNPPFSGNDQLAQQSMEHILHFVIGDGENYYWNEDAFNDKEFNLIHEALYGGTEKKRLLRNLIIPNTKVFPDGGNVSPGLIETNVYNPHHLNKLLEEQGFVLTHKALYDYEIPMLLILPTTKENDICLDIFNGLGTTGLVAYATNRSYIGVELSPLYSVQTKARFKALFLKEKKELIQESIPKKTEVLKKKSISKKVVRSGTK
jgi:DNA modification methylase